MRIAITTWTNRRVGGIETYLGNIIPELQRAGHELALFTESEAPSDRESLLDGSQEVSKWIVQEIGRDSAMNALRSWRPDLIYAHGMRDASLEHETLSIAPGVFFIHNYHGTCISGTKTHKFPIITPCSKKFGAACLLHYFPRRCGGWSPISMMREFVAQSRRLEVVKRFDAIVTHSHHMYAEYLKNGIDGARLHRIVYYSPEEAHGSMTVQQCSRDHWNLTFVGRMDRLKGGDVLIDAMRIAAPRLERPCRVVFAGDGPARAAWQKLASTATSSNVRFDFVGWKSKPEVAALIRDSDLIVFPSVWPEPFGLVGPEAGRAGVPVVAFAVGGVRDWLIGGVNGYLAPGNPPTANGLALAIIKALRNDESRHRLSVGAVEMAKRFERESHLNELMDVFARIPRVARK